MRTDVKTAQKIIAIACILIAISQVAAAILMNVRYIAVAFVAALTAIASFTWSEKENRNKAPDVSDRIFDKTNKTHIIK